MMVIKIVEETDPRQCSECGGPADNRPGGFGFFDADTPATVGELSPVCETCAREIDPEMVALVGLVTPARNVGFYAPKGKNGRRALKELAEAARQFYESGLYDVRQVGEQAEVEIVH
jgi:hypothetical protein